MSVLLSGSSIFIADAARRCLVASSSGGSCSSSSSSSSISTTTAVPMVASESCDEEGMLSRGRRRRRRSVAVIGAGAAGLAAAKELREEGHSVVVFEQDQSVGGVWVYSPDVEDDPLGLNPHRSRVHSSMYSSLRTNLPREIMGFLDFPFLPHPEDTNRDPRRYPSHSEVLSYLQDFAQHFNLVPCIRFGRIVTHAGVQPAALLLERDDETLSGSTNCDPPFSTVAREDADIQWQVSSEGPGGIDRIEEIFDAVVVCNGHYFQPRIAEIPGVETWPGKQLHSHNYRLAHPFAHQVVVVIGNSSSGVDISRELATVAKEVCWAARTWEPDIDMTKPVGLLDNITLHPMVHSADKDGTIKFEDGSSVVADIILHCTGYDFSFPFLDLKGIVKVDKGCVEPLYQHVFPPSLSPSISFVGLPYKVIPFPLMQLQARWIAFTLAGKVQPPSRQEMMRAVQELHATLEEKGTPKRRTHDLGAFQTSILLDNLKRLGTRAKSTKHVLLLTAIKKLYERNSEDSKQMPMVSAHAD